MAPDEIEETPQSLCPNCGKWVDDLDGFGVLAHYEPMEDACGYCSHPSRDAGICSICGDIRYYEGDEVTLHGTAGRAVKPLRVVEDLGTPHMVLCRDPHTGSIRTYARSSLRPRQEKRPEMTATAL